MDGKIIEYRATRKPLFYTILGMAVLHGLIAAAFGVAFAVSGSGEAEVVAAFAVTVVIFVGLAFAVKNIAVKTYVFDGNGVTVKRGKKEVRRYERRDIKELRYVPLSVRYFFRGRGNGVGIAMCVTVVFKNGKYKTLFWFNAEIANELKNLYGRFMVMYN